MTVNLLAGVACTVAGILAAIWVVELYMRHAARARWSRVSVLTYRAIAAHLCDLMVEALTSMTVLRDHRPMTAILSGRESPDPQTIEGLVTLASMLRAVPDPWSNDVSGEVVAFYEKNKWDLDQLCDGLLPRVIEYSDEQDLIDALTEFDGARRALHNAVLAHKKITIGGIISSLAGLVDASANVYRSLLNHWRD